MKIKLSLFIFVSFVIFLMSGCSNKNGIINIKEVDSVTICYSCNQATKLDPNVTENEKIIQKLSDWVNHSKVLGGTVERTASVGGLEFHLKDGSTLMIQDDVNTNCKSGLSGTTDCHGEDAKNQVIIYQGDHKPIRILSPELKAWIDGKWKEDFN